MKTRQLLLATLALLMIPVTAQATAALGYGSAQIFQANTTVQLLSVSLGQQNEGTLRGLKCLFPSTDDSAMVEVKITTDAGKSNEKDLSFTVDPTYFHQESNGAGNFTSDWIRLNVTFFFTLLVQLNNTGLGTATINCWASYSSFGTPE